MIFSNNSFSQEKIFLPQPLKKGKQSFEEVIDIRKSIRDYSSEALTKEELSNLLWAAYGKNAYRKTVPSAGALYPIVIYLIAGKVKDLNQGVYRYDANRHCLIKNSDKDVREDLTRAALSQDCIKEAPVIIAICARYEITASKYGERGTRYVHIETGHVAQNIYLQAVNLRLGTVAVGAFYDEQVKKILDIEEDPLLLMPVGKPY